MPKTRIVIADRRPIVLAGLRVAIEAAPVLRIVGEARSGPEALERILQTRPNVLICELALPGMNGIELLRSIREQELPVRVVLLFEQVSNQASHAVEKEGAAELLSKDCDFATLRVKVQALAAGRSRTDRAAPTARTDAAPARSSGAQVLSPQEIRVLRLLAQEKSSKDIAEVLAIQPRTVDTHRANIMKKLDIHTVLGLVRYGLRSGIIDSP